MSIKPVTKAMYDFLRNESGATALEYAFILTLISLAILGGIAAIGGSVLSYFTDAYDALIR